MTAVQIQDARMQDLQKTFKANRLMFAHRHIETASTLLKLLEMEVAQNKVEKLRRMTEKALSNALRSLGALPQSNGDAALARSAIVRLQQRLAQSGPQEQLTALETQSVA